MNPQVQFHPAQAMTQAAGGYPPMPVAIVQQGPPKHVFTWRYGGTEVLLIGSFDNWQQRLPMERVSGQEF